MKRRLTTVLKGRAINTIIFAVSNREYWPIVGVMTASVTHDARLIKQMRYREHRRRKESETAY